MPQPLLARPSKPHQVLLPHQLLLVGRRSLDKYVLARAYGGTLMGARAGGALAPRHHARTHLALAIDTWYHTSIVRVITGRCLLHCAHTRCVTSREPRMSPSDAEKARHSSTASVENRSPHALPEKRADIAAKAMACSSPEGGWAGGDCMAHASRQTAALQQPCRPSSAPDVLARAYGGALAKATVP